jgi:hypothetical protein
LAGRRSSWSVTTMNDRTAVQTRGAQHAQSIRRGGPPGRLVVEEYVGRVALDAAQAVRCAGLRSGLVRSFGCEAELIGLVVAQEPVAGSDLARNGMVTLYVAAPGNAPLDADTASETSGEPPPAASVQAGVAPADAVSAASARRRRKQGLAEHATPVFDPPPAPVPPDRRPAGEVHATPVIEVPPEETLGSPEETYKPDGEELDEGTLDKRNGDGLSHEEFVVHADDVFARRTDRPLVWRRVYPRSRTAGALRSSRGARAWLQEHPPLIKAVGAMLAVGTVVGLAVTLDDGHPARTPTAHVISGSHRRAETRTRISHGGVSAPSVRTVRPAARSPRPHTPPQHREAPRRRPTTAPVSEAPALPEGAGVQVAPPPPLPPPARASGPSSPAQEQTQGGPFSP